MIRYTMTTPNTVNEPATPNFGLVHVDYPTQARTPKSSYHWYRDLIRHYPG
ncbi:MAG: family 1 glycosylhydrolase [Streptosporangiaceae bacterium]